MRKRGFTLIELLTIIAILSIVVTAVTVSIQAGTAAARMRGAVRDVFATVRQARSVALVSQKPCILTFKTVVKDGTAVSSAEIVSTELLTSKSLLDSTGRAPRSIDGYKTLPGEAEEPQNDSRAAFVVSNRDDPEAAKPDEGGHTVEETLFRPIDEEILTGICIRVVMAEEEVEDNGVNVDEAKRSRVSTFSNTDFLLSRFKERTKKTGQDAAGETPAATRSSGESEVEEMEKSILWQTNGRTDPHTIYVYAETARDWQREAWAMEVDRFGAVKVLEDD